MRNLPANLLVAERCTSRGGRGVVSAAATDAAVIGRDALIAGGNAFDAALAAALAETVLLPSKCGLAGDVVALVATRDDPAPRCLLAIGTAPVGLADWAATAGELPLTGGASVGVPAAPGGYAALAELGVLGLKDAVQPAIRLAQAGFAWPLISQRYTEISADLLREQNPQGTRYLPGGAPHRTGDLVRLPGMAELLSIFGDRGAAVFDDKPGDALLRAIKRRGGVITRADIDAQQPIWTDPCTAELDGRRVWTTPSPTHGPSLLDALDRAGAAPSPYDLVVAVADAVAFRERNAGDAAGDAGTSVVTAADEDGNAVVLVHSNSHPTFASGVVVEEYDLVLSNRAGRGFSPVPGHPNFPAAGRRPMTTLHAWALGDADGPTTLGATSGGEDQMAWNAQVLYGLLAGKRVEQVVFEPLWALDRGTGEALLEADVSGDYDPPSGLVREMPVWGHASGLQAVTRDRRTGLMTATSDIRCVGGTAGW